MTDWLDTKQQTQVAEQKVSFKLEEEESTVKEVYTIYGRKGVGKSTFALGFPGNVVALSFDKKTTMAKNNARFDVKDRVRVFDAIKYYERDSTKVLNAAVKSYEYIKFLLDEFAKMDPRPDWVLIDGIEVLQKMGEFVMRKEGNLKPYSGVANPNLWKIRNAMIDDVHQRAYKAARKGVIYTTYIKNDKLVEDGTLITEKEVPKYIDTVMLETDIVLKVEGTFDSKNKQYKVMLKCESSKNDDRIKTGSWNDITGQTADQVINFGVKK